MVVRVLEAHLHGVVVNIRNGQLGLYLWYAQCLELEICHGPRGVLRQCLVDTYADLVTRYQRPFNQVFAKYLVKNRLSHGGYLFRWNIVHTNDIQMSFVLILFKYFFNESTTVKQADSREFAAKSDRVAADFASLPAGFFRYKAHENLNRHG